MYFLNADDFMGLIDTIFGRKKPAEEKKQATTKDVMASLTAKEKEFYLKLYIEYVNMLLATGGKQNDTFTYSAEARKEALDLVARLIWIDKCPLTEQRAKVREELEILVKQGAVSDSVKRLMAEPAIDDVISSETANLVLESQEQIDEVCGRIVDRVWRLRTEAMESPHVTHIYHGFEKWPDLPKEDREKINRLKERMLQQLGNTGGAAYRQQLKRFNVEVRLEEINYDKYWKIFFLIERALLKAGAKRENLGLRVFEILADFIIASEKRDSFDKNSIIEELRRLFRVKKWRKERSRGDEPRVEAENFSDKNKRKFVQFYIDSLKERIEEGRVPYSHARSDALAGAYAKAKEKRPSMETPQEKFEQLLKRLLDENFDYRRREISDLEERAFQRKAREIQSKMLPEVVYGSEDIEALCNKFSYQIKLWSFDGSDITQQEDEFRSGVERKYCSEENLRNVIGDQLEVQYKEDVLKSLAGHKDLAGLLVSANRALPLMEDCVPAVPILYASILAKKIEKEVDKVLSEGEAVKQQSAEVKEIDREINELKERYDALPGEMRSEKGFRKQLDEQLAALNRRRKGLLGGKIGAVNFFTEYEPGLLHRKIKEIFTALHSEKMFPGVWRKIAEMAAGQPTFTKGANPDWNRAGEIG